MKLKDAEKRLKNEPTNLGLKVQVAGMMREAGRSLEAVELYRSVALAYRDQGRTQQAIAVCRSILEIAPEDAACQGLLGMLQQRSSSVKAPTKPPVNQEPARPRTEQAVMRASPMPPAPEVPSLRPQTSPPPQRAATATAQTRPTTPGRPASTSPPPRTSPTSPPPRTSPTSPPPRTAPPGPPPRSSPTSPPRPDEPTRRSSFEATPLPPALPYHLADRTSSPSRISSGDIDADTRPEQNPSGLAHAARRISGLISDSRGIPSEVDLSSELDTRQRRKIASEELNKIAAPPPTIPIERLDDIDDMTTPPPPDHDLISARPTAPTPQPRGSEESMPLPSRPSNASISSSSLPRVQPPKSLSSPNLPRIGPPRTSSRPPAVVSIPPKSPSYPPGQLPAVKAPSYPPGQLPAQQKTPSYPPSQLT
ncbi:MAG TPA: hypothetical protein VIV40_15410, partial [Kofleriaceae bacterium]